MTTGAERGARAAGRLALGLALLALGCAPGAAADWGVADLMRSLAQVKEARGRFVERRDLAALTAPLRSSGTLVYVAPGHLEKQTTKPAPESLVLDGDRLTIGKIEGGPKRVLNLPDYPVLWAFVESIRSTLAGDLGTLNRFYRVELGGRESQWRLVLVPIEPKMREFVREIRIDGRRDRIDTISVFESGGDRSTLTITRDDAS
jgi:Outer membrane lipoprotein carrier protein LolA-like